MRQRKSRVVSSSPSRLSPIKRKRLSGYQSSADTVRSLGTAPPGPSPPRPRALAPPPLDRGDPQALTIGVGQGRAVGSPGGGTQRRPVGETDRRADAQQRHARRGRAAPALAGGQPQQGPRGGGGGAEPGPR